MAKRWFLVAWSLLACIKLLLAASLPLFGDEAFYWWESRHPAWSYSDLPPLTAWLIALGTSVSAGELGVRLPFLVLGLCLPWQLRALTTRHYGEAAGWQAGLLALLLPLSALLGVMALPDVVMAIATLAAVDRLARTAVNARVGDWLMLGAWLAIGLLSHYRFAIVPLVIAAVIVWVPALRRQLRGSSPWLAVAIAMLGALPTLWFNLANEWAGLQFQFVDRHPWAWQWSGFWQLPEQLLVASPILLVVLGWLAGSAWRRGFADISERVVVSTAVGLWLLFFVLGFFADSTRFRWHWPLPAFLLLLPVVASRWSQLRRWLRLTATGCAAGITAAMFAYLALIAIPGNASDRLAGKLFPDNFSGWREVSAWLSADPGTGAVVVDNFMLAAELAFYSTESVRSRIRVLDDPRNDRHGRAAQLRLWSKDEGTLAAQSGQDGVVIAEEGARRFVDRLPWYRSICRRFEQLELDDVLDLHQGRRRFVRWRFQGYTPAAECRQPEAIPPIGWIEIIRDEAGAPQSLGGWALQPGVGIDHLVLSIDGHEVDRALRDQDVYWAEQYWGDTGDPAGHWLQFRFPLDLSSLPAGRHLLAVRAVRGDGREWPIASEFVLVP